MKVKELIEILQKYPQDMEVWVSDRGASEGGEKLITIEKVAAHDAGLDGDEVDDEYIYIDDDTNIQEYLDKGYLLSEDEDVLYKEIIYLNDH